MGLKVNEELIKALGSLIGERSNAMAEPLGCGVISIVLSNEEAVVRAPQGMALCCTISAIESTLESLKSYHASLKDSDSCPAKEESAPVENKDLDPTLN